MKILKIILIIMFCILLASCQQISTVTGTVNYRERIVLPPEGTVITVQMEYMSLNAMSLVDVPTVVIGEQIIENPRHQVPIPFEIKYNPRDIDERYIYSIRARIEVNGELWFTNAIIYRVITGGYPTSNVEVILENVGAKLK